MCQQAAEKFMKGFLFAQGRRVLTTHSIKKLAREAADHDKAFKELEKAGKDLDDYYFMTRYPDALVDDIPAEHFDSDDAKEALQNAQKIKDTVLSKL